MTTEHSNAASADVSEPRDQVASRHTPGPWIANGTTVETRQGLSIAKCGSSPNRSVNSAIENARLLAAAPELLEALKEIEYCIAGVNPAALTATELAVISTVRAVLAKVQS